MLVSLYPPTMTDPAVPAGTWWEDSAPALDADTTPLEGDASCDIAIIGAGYTGLSAALRLAGTHNVDVRVVEAGEPGFGAAGRNGGFCCIPATKLSWTQVIRRVGVDEAKRFMASQIEAIETVRELLESHAIDADYAGHEGELLLAHSGWASLGLATEAKLLRDTFGFDVKRFMKSELPDIGADGPGFISGMLSPYGFGLHPLKYLRGLADAVVKAGVPIHAASPVTEIKQEREGYRLITPRGEIASNQVIVATNGYTNEAVIRDLAYRTLPVISSVLVTRPMTDAEYDAQGFSTRIMSYDSRNLLHYFRRLPDNRFLFGGRGGTDGSIEGLKASRQAIRETFDKYFPEWKNVETTHEWSGLACIMRNRQPFIGTIDWKKKMWGALGYHGNGVATGTWSGKMVADMAVGAMTEEDLPALFVSPIKMFSRSRQTMLKLRYWANDLEDRI